MNGFGDTITIQEGEVAVELLCRHQQKIGQCPDCEEEKQEETKDNGRATEKA